MSKRFKTTRAWLVHFYTATGLIAAFAAFRAMLDGDAHAVFLWLGLATFIDATDGPLARRWEVTRWTPAFNGRKLDDIVDYINYTFIPVLLAYRFGLVAGVGTAVLPVVLMASAYGFCQETAKTDDGYFTGFPSYWNLIIFYLYLFDAAPWVSAVVLGVFAALVFVPVKYLTWKSLVLHRLTLVLSLTWCAVMAGLLVWFDAAPRWGVWFSLLYPTYHISVSFYLYVRSSLENSG
ncbi:MAG: CDP-alcohol phosphatidyltransferase [Anaerolineae bacterium]|nr:CDP-alcohol phosphatidyltransferase [Anaerolineae bacterium]